jgi:hypothetical protein
MKFIISILFLGYLQLALAGGPAPDKPDPSSCAIVTDLNKPETDIYYKSICIVNTEKTQAEALAYCGGIGMRLLTVTLDGEVSLVRQPSGPIYINANRSDGQWVASNPTEPVSDVVVNNLFADNGESCLFIWPSGIIETANCDQSKIFICQFDKNLV